MDTPANHMTPVIFAERVESLFASDDAVQVVVRDQVNPINSPLQVLLNDPLLILSMLLFYLNSFSTPIGCVRTEALVQSTFNSIMYGVNSEKYSLYKLLGVGG